MRTGLRFENCDLELTAAGIGAESPKCVGTCVDGLVADSPTEERGAAPPSLKLRWASQ